MFDGSIYASIIMLQHNGMDSIKTIGFSWYQLM
jgi:hypothetical protein